MQPINKNIGQNKDTSAKTFIERARRAQIVTATIEVLATKGYTNTSFAHIAKYAGISTGLISYHFKDKGELMQETLQTLLADRGRNVDEAIANEVTATEKLRSAIAADMAYMGTEQKRFQASAEIMFSLRTQEGTMHYIGDTDSPMATRLQKILEDGKKNGEFGNIDPFNVTVLIEGAQNHFLAQLGMRPKFQLEPYTQLLISTIIAITKKEASA